MGVLLRKNGRSRRMPSMRVQERYEHLLLELRSKTSPVVLQRKFKAAVKETTEAGSSQASRSFRWRRGYCGAWTLR